MSIKVEKVGDTKFNKSDNTNVIFMYTDTKIETMFVYNCNQWNISYFLGIFRARTLYVEENCSI